VPDFFALDKKLLKQNAVHNRLTKAPAATGMVKGTCSLFFFCVKNPVFTASCLIAFM
jgi:hypothetical protein